MIHITESTSETKISRLELIKDEGKYKAKWMFPAECVDGFLVILAEASDPEESIETKIIRQLEEFFADRQLQGTHDLDTMQIRALQQMHYTNRGVPLIGIRQVRQPMQLRVLSYRKTMDGYELFWQCNGENTAYIPCMLEFEKSVSKPLLGSLTGKNAHADIRIPAVKEYQDGILYYVLDNQNVKYPITRKMLGREFSVELTKSGAFEMRVDKKFQHLYKCRESDGGR